MAGWQGAVQEEQQPCCTCSGQVRPRCVPAASGHTPCQWPLQPPLKPACTRPLHSLPLRGRMEEGVQALEADSGHLDKTFWVRVPRRWPGGGMQALWAHSHGPWPSQPGGRAQLEEGWMGLGIKCALSPCLSAQFGGHKVHLHFCSVIATLQHQDFFIVPNWKCIHPTGTPNAPAPAPSHHYSTSGRSQLVCFGSLVEAASLRLAYFPAPVLPKSKGRCWAERL